VTAGSAHHDPDIGDDRMAAALLARGLVEPPDLEMARALQAEEERAGRAWSLGQVLIRTGCIDAPDYIRVLHQLNAPVYRCSQCLSTFRPAEVEVLPDEDPGARPLACRVCGVKLEIPGGRPRASGVGADVGGMSTHTNEDDAGSQRTQSAWRSSLRAGPASGIDVRRSSKITLPRAPNPAPAPAVPSFGPYTVHEVLGRGGMGIVYKAQHRAREGWVALKVLRAGQGANKNQILRFRREAESVSRLEHPGLVRLLDSGTADGAPYLAMEYVEGETLQDRLVRGDLYSEADALVLTAQIARAVHHAHEQGIVHRDLKPGNVILSPLGPKVTDFGLAKLLDGGGVRVTRKGVAIGTPLFMSPEQAAGHSATADRRADVFAMGILLYVLLTDNLPFQGTSHPEIYKAIREADPPAPRSLNPLLSEGSEAVLRRALAKSVDDRYATAQALAEDCERLASGRQVSDPLGSLDPSQRSPSASDELPTVLSSPSRVDRAEEPTDIGRRERAYMQDTRGDSMEVPRTVEESAEVERSPQPLVLDPGPSEGLDSLDSLDSALFGVETVAPPSVLDSTSELPTGLLSPPGRDPGMAGGSPFASVSGASFDPLATAAPPVAHPGSPLGPPPSLPILDSTDPDQAGLSEAALRSDGAGGGFALGLGESVFELSDGELARPEVDRLADTRRPPPADRPTPPATVEIAQPPKFPASPAPGSEPAKRRWPLALVAALLLAGAAFGGWSLVGGARATDDSPLLVRAREALESGDPEGCLRLAASAAQESPAAAPQARWLEARARQQLGQVDSAAEALAALLEHGAPSGLRARGLALLSHVNHQRGLHTRALDALQRLDDADWELLPDDERARARLLEARLQARLGDPAARASFDAAAGDQALSEPDRARAARWGRWIERLAERRQLDGVGYPVVAGRLPELGLVLLGADRSQPDGLVAQALEGQPVRLEVAGGRPGALALLDLEGDGELEVAVCLSRAEDEEVRFLALRGGLLRPVRRVELPGRTPAGGLVSWSPAPQRSLLWAARHDPRAPLAARLVEAAGGAHPGEALFEDLAFYGEQAVAAVALPVSESSSLLALIDTTPDSRRGLRVLDLRGDEPTLGDRVPSPTARALAWLSPSRVGVLQESGAVQVYALDGTRLVWELTWSPPPCADPLRALHLAAGDLDGDGAREAVWVVERQPRGAPAERLLVVQGAEGQQLVLPAGDSGALAGLLVVDLDGDEQAEIALVGHDRVVILGAAPR
jgi:serine/threonine protein kinase